MTADLRVPERRRDTFQRFYSFHLEHGTHPGCVYFALPGLARELGWGPEERLWAAFVNGLTQNPVTTYLLVRDAPGPEHAERLVDTFRARAGSLLFDTDRRHQKPKTPAAVDGYLRELAGAPQLAWWGDRAAGGWIELWAAANALPTFGRLSAWSFLEYLRITGDLPEFDAPQLYLDDWQGSRSHRNGLAIVAGRDDLDWRDKTAPNPYGVHVNPRGPLDLHAMEDLGEDLLAEARRRNAGRPWARDVSRLSLESALCTYKGWHRPRRRYPNVYADLMYDRLRYAEARGDDVGLLWRVREVALPRRLRLEENPYDPGCVPPKQDHYLTTGEPPMMPGDDLWRTRVESREFGRRPR